MRSEKPFNRRTNTNCQMRPAVRQTMRTGMRFPSSPAMAGATIQARAPIGRAAAAQIQRTRAVKYCGMSVSTGIEE